MKSTFVMAQLQSEPDPNINLIKAENAIKEAFERYRPDCMIFPEVFMCSFPAGTAREKILSSAQSLDGSFVKGMKQMAQKYGVWIIFGMREAVEDSTDDRNYNTVLILNAEGETVEVYRKTHLYDAFGTKESENVKPGGALFNPIETPFGKIGLFVCYEVRFPEVARDQAMKGAEIIIMPTAWVKGDLKSLHFRSLITARAIENTVYMLACDQCGPRFLGESVAVDPMGVPVASGNEREDLIPVYVDTERIVEVRKKLPSMKDRRSELYRA